MAEFQTVSAAFDVARLAVAACIFLKKVKDADKAVDEVHDRVQRLSQVLKGVQHALELREEKGLVPEDRGDVQTEERINACIKASGKILDDMQKKVGGFKANATNTPVTAVVERVKVVLRHPSIVKLQTDLEARISSLQTDLSLLQLSDHLHTDIKIDANHEELLQTLSELGANVSNGNQLLHHILLEQRKLSTAQQVADLDDLDQTVEDSTAIEDLRDCLRHADSVHERYTSEYIPDDRSIRINRDMASEQDKDSPSHVATPGSEQDEPDRPRLSSSASARSRSDLADFQDDNEEDDDEDEEVWPLEVLNLHIDAYLERASKERDQGHFNQAEVNLQSAIKYSELRERRYNVTFSDRLERQEEVAILYQNMQKWADAVSKVSELLRQSGDETAQARQNQLLASIYHDRHLHRNGPALSYLTDDIEKAEKHAKRAFRARFDKISELPSEEVERHHSCTSLLVRILNARDKTEEANVLSKLLSDSSSSTSDSLRRISTATQEREFVMVQDKQQLLFNAVKAGDTEQIQLLTGDLDVDIERLDRLGKTALMYAVEKSDETTVHKLLDPVVGADVNKANKKGLTALHLAAQLGLHDMVRCLIHHDADIEARDSKGETPVTKAVRKDQGTIVQILADHNAELEIKTTDEWSLLHHATHLSSANMIIQLLGLASELRDAVDQAGKTALHHCTENELVDQASALLEHRNHVDVNALDSVSRSPLYLAASKPPTPKRESMVRLLLKHGAQLDETRPPPRYRDYVALKPYSAPRRTSALVRSDSVSTEGTVGSTSTAQTKLSRIFSSRMGFHR